MRCSYGSSMCNSALRALNEDDWLASSGTAGHLFDGLAWTLRAAQEWQAQSELALGVDGYATQVYSMDAVFLRARELFEFFTKRGQNYCHARCLFRLSGQLSGPSSLRRWMNELHIGAMHFQDRRSGGPLPLHDGSGMADLNQMPAEIAKGVIEMWEEFEQALGANGHMAQQAKAQQCRLQAIEDSRRVVTNMGLRAEAYKSKANMVGGLTILWP